PRAKEDRLAAKDPRPALLERYRDFADYEQQYLAAAEKLVAGQYLLAEDLPRHLPSPAARTPSSAFPVARPPSRRPRSSSKKSRPLRTPPISRSPKRNPSPTSKRKSTSSPRHSKPAAPRSSAPAPRRKSPSAK